jgi:hypothetical protein
MAVECRLLRDLIIATGVHLAVGGPFPARRMRSSMLGP